MQMKFESVNKMKSKMKKSLFVTLIICVLFAMSALSVQAAGKTGWVRKGTTYKYKVNNTYVKDEVKKIKKYYWSTSTHKAMQRLVVALKMLKKLL